MSNNIYGNNLQTLIKNQEDILKILNQLTAKMDGVENAMERNDRRISERIESLENILSDKLVGLSNNVQTKLSNHQVNISPDMLFEFDAFHRKHFTKAIIESFYGPVTRSVSDLIR